LQARYEDGVKCVSKLVAYTKEACRTRIFENRKLRRIFGPKRDEVTGEWRRLHKEELYDPHSSPNIIRVIKSSRRLRRAGNVACMGKSKVSSRVLVGKHDERRPLVRPRSI
jgi:hypothetical protein